MPVPASAPTLTVVVPATDAPPTLVRCLQAIRRAADGPDEVIVVDEPETLSAAAARNAGARRASGEVLVFVDSDVEVHPDAFTRVRAAYAADPDLVAVYGAYDDLPAAPTTVSAFRNLLHHHVHRSGAGPSETFWTGLGAVRTRAFLAIGGFDEERYPHPSIEDIELGDRLSGSGARVVLDPAIQGTHLKAWTLRSMLWTDFARRGVPWVALQVQRRRVSSALNLGWRHRLSAAACLAGLLGALAFRSIFHVFLATALVVLCVLNRAFYALLLRRQGIGRALVGIGLHALHHLVAVVAVPVGIGAGLVAESRATAERWRAVPPPIPESSLVE
jgi:GT2 family glycosyltransferase